MSRVLVDIITEQTGRMFYNIGIMLRTCNLDFALCELPVWKHAYHMLHSCDQWFINPRRFGEPAFHTPGLNSLNQADENALSREDLLNYCENIKQKIFAYLGNLSDEQLSEKPEGCEYARLSLILGSFRHTYAHLGNINGTTIVETGSWPRCVGMRGEAEMDGELYEYIKEKEGN